jgi:hypothetical protein
MPGYPPGEPKPNCRRPYATSDLCLGRDPVPAALAGIFAPPTAAETILKALQVRGHQPQIDRPVEELPETYREWIIDFSDSGYVARYRFEGGVVTILALRHQKEAGC